MINKVQKSNIDVIEELNSMKIENMNCLDGMKKIPNNSIDMVCTDPPYFLDGLDEDWNTSVLEKRGSSELVKSLPRGMKFDRKQSKKFNEFYKKVSSEVYRILKPGGAFVSFSSPRLYHSLATAVEDEGFEIRDMLGWVYSQSQVKAFKQDHIIENDKYKTSQQKKDLIKMCSDWRTPMLKPAIEPICFSVKPLEGRYIDNFEKYGTGLMNCSKETQVNGKFPLNVITTEEGVLESKIFMIKKPNKKEKGFQNSHLSVKPVELIQHLIQLFTREGATVLDPFMGSGTTAVACVRSKRKYLGFEINEAYIKISEDRLKREFEETII